MLENLITNIKTVLVRVIKRLTTSLCFFLGLVQKGHRGSGHNRISAGVSQRKGGAETDKCKESISIRFMHII